MKYNRRKSKEIDNHYNLVKHFKVNLDRLHVFFIDTFEQSFLCFFQLLNTSIHTAIFYKGFIAVSGSAKNECGSPALMVSIRHALY